MISRANKIFVVDDDPGVLASVRALLSNCDYEVACFNSAEAFLGSTAVNDHGCVLTDLHMPGMSGQELIKKVRESFPNFSVVVVTGVADVSMAVRVMEDGAVTLLQKPYAPASLLAALEKAVIQSSARYEEAALCLDVKARLATLNEEEHEVMEYLLRGYSNKQVVRELSMSPRTTDRRKQSLLKKMGVQSIPELATLLGRVHLL